MLRTANGRRIALPVIGAVTAAFAASACCLGPAILALLGVSGVGFAARFAPYRPFFLAATAISLGAGFWFAYRRQRDDCGCAVPRRRRATRVALWISAVLAVAIAVYPMLGSGTATAGSSDVAAKATLELTVIGMDCKECTATIASAIKRVPGVVSVHVDYAAGNAVVGYDGRDGMANAAIKAVEDAGYHAEVRR